MLHQSPQWDRSAIRVPQFIIVTRFENTPAVVEREGMFCVLVAIVPTLVMCKPEGRLAHVLRHNGPADTITSLKLSVIWR